MDHLDKWIVCLIFIGLTTVNLVSKMVNVWRYIIFNDNTIISILAIINMGDNEDSQFNFFNGRYTCPAISTRLPCVLNDEECGRCRKFVKSMLNNFHYIFIHNMVNSVL